MGNLFLRMGGAGQAVEWGRNLETRMEEVGRVVEWDRNLETRMEHGGLRKGVRVVGLIDLGPLHSTAFPL